MMNKLEILNFNKNTTTEVLNVMTTENKNITFPKVIFHIFRNRLHAEN